MNILLIYCYVCDHYWHSMRKYYFILCNGLTDILLITLQMLCWLRIVLHHSLPHLSWSHALSFSLTLHLWGGGGLTLPIFKLSTILRRNFFWSKSPCIFLYMYWLCVGTIFGSFWGNSQSLGAFFQHWQRKFMGKKIVPGAKNHTYTSS